MKVLRALLIIIVVIFCIPSSAQAEMYNESQSIQSIQSTTPFKDKGFITLTFKNLFGGGGDWGDYATVISSSIIDSASRIEFDYRSSNPNANIKMSNWSRFSEQSGFINYLVDAPTKVTLYNIRIIYDYKPSGEYKTLDFEGEFSIIFHPTSVDMYIGNNEMIVHHFDDPSSSSSSYITILDVVPYVKYGRTYVPIRALSEGFGANVIWNNVSQTITIDLYDQSIVMIPGSYNYWIDGNLRTMDAVPEIVQGRAFVPVRFVAEAFGIHVNPIYDSYNGTTVAVKFIP